MKVKGHCRTNLDDYDVGLVHEFYRVPLVGERVRVSLNNQRDTLKVVGVTHDIYNEEPYIIVELNN
jgi:hypothetical protein